VDHCKYEYAIGARGSDPRRFLGFHTIETAIFQHVTIYISYGRDVICICLVRPCRKVDIRFLTTCRLKRCQQHCSKQQRSMPSVEEMSSNTGQGPGIASPAPLTNGHTSQPSNTHQDAPVRPTLENGRSYINLDNLSKEKHLRTGSSSTIQEEEPSTRARRSASTSKPPLLVNQNQIQNHQHQQSQYNPQYQPPRVATPKRTPLFDSGQSYSQRFHNRSSSFSVRSARARSLSASSQEALKHLAPPVSVPLVVCCLMWYLSSAMSNTLGKAILTKFGYPVTLSQIQFLVAVCCGATTIQLSQMSPKFRQALPPGMVGPQGLIFPPTRDMLKTTAPMGCFQLSGHILSHMATGMIPVSLVHTIKALSPLFTVAAYRLLFNVQYSPSTYLSLIPLVTGVILTCSTSFRAQFMGIIYALLAALVFVSQNMFSKKLLTSGTTAGPGGPASATHTRKLDKLNILCYCTALAFLFTSPLWFFSEGWTLLKLFFRGEALVKDDSSLFVLMIQLLLNGVVHFAQNLLAFQVLSMVSPVTYSVASLLKRIVVIVWAIIWFGQSVSGIQGFGIFLTFTGLYLYDRCGGDKKKGGQGSSVDGTEKDAQLPK
jgi:solute carrier family 35 protein E1